MAPIINNYKYLGLYTKEPPYLEEYGDIGPYKVYHSYFNPLVYVIKNPKDSFYYAFESSGSTKDSLEHDLKINIRVYFDDKSIGNESLEE